MANRFAALADNKALNQIGEALQVNVSDGERIGSIAAGAALVVLGLSRKSIGGWLLALAGGALVARGATGHCLAYENLGINSGNLNRETGVPGDRGINVERSITVARPPAEAFRFWRQLENLPQIFEHVESVRELDTKRSIWVVKGPLGHDVEWTAEIINERNGEMLSWESLPGAEVQNAGSVWFEPAAGGGTRVKVSLQYLPPAGAVGAALARWFGEAPEVQLAEDLARFKQALESRPLATAR